MQMGYETELDFGVGEQKWERQGNRYVMLKNVFEGLTIGKLAFS